MRPFLTVCLLAALALGIAGCFNPFDPRVSVERVTTAPPPSPTSPANTVRLFAWCWQNRDADRYAELFTDDYRFLFADGDSAGQPFHDRPWLREDEMNMATHMFSGGGDQAAASDISIITDNLLVAMPDTRPGHLFRWHQTIRFHVDLKVTVTDASGTPSVTPVVGYARFYLCRGDSALIPPELVSRGFKPDSTRWWIERWEDETLSAGGTAARPVIGALAAALGPPARPAIGEPYERPRITFGALKFLYK